MQGDFIYMLTYFGTFGLIPLTKRALLLLLRVLDSRTVREFI